MQPNNDDLSTVLIIIRGSCAPRPAPRLNSVLILTWTMSALRLYFSLLSVLNFVSFPFFLSCRSKARCTRDNLSLESRFFCNEQTERNDSYRWE